MSNTIPDCCPNCGNDSGTDRAFVPYEPEPNGAQEETEWAANLPSLRGFVCTNCGFVLGVIDTQDRDDAGNNRAAGRFRVEDPLE